MIFKVIRYTVLILFFISAAKAQNSIDSTLKTPDSITTPFPSLVEFANKHDIALNNIAIGGSDSQPEKGNSVTFLLTLHQDSSIQQWLSIISQDSLTPNETKMKPLRDKTLYSSTGRVFKYKNTRTALNVNIIGPFEVTKSESENIFKDQLDNPHRVFVSKEYLNCKLDRYAETAMAITRRCEAAGVKGGYLFHIGSSKPISKKNLEKGKSYIRYTNATYEEEQRVFNVSFALKSFYAAAMEIKEFREIVYKVMDKPSGWSAITHFGLRPFLRYASADVQPFDAKGLGIDFPAYELPLQLFLNDKLAFKSSIIMTESRPPLQACAGIVVTYIEHPVEKGKSLLIQLISANIKPERRHNIALY